MTGYTAVCAGRRWKRTTPTQLGRGLVLGLLVCANVPADEARPAAKPAAKNPSPAAEYRVLPLDTLQITVFQEPDLTGKFEVSQAGAIKYPLLESVEVGGLTVSEVEKKITTLLGQGYLVNPQINIAVESSGGRGITVTGQVKKQGVLKLAAGKKMMLREAIALAEGFTNVAATGRVRITREEGDKRKTIEVDVRAIENGKRDDVELKPGDSIYVPETAF